MKSTDPLQFQQLLARVRACRHCEEDLPLGPRPVLRASTTSRVLLVGQAPGTRVHATGIPWNDPSGDRLREWLDIERKDFYDESRVAIIPMGLCYPGKGKGGDLPPRPECAQLWFQQLLAGMPALRLRVLIGQYAIRYYLGKKRKKTLAETVAAFEDYLPQDFPLPHPSPRNLMWRRRNPWFEEEVVPRLRQEFHRALKA